MNQKEGEWLWITPPNTDNSDFMSLIKKIHDNIQHCTYTSDLFNTEEKRFTKIILIDRNWSKREILWSDLFVALSINNYCLKREIHFTWVIEDFYPMPSIDNIFELFHTNHLILKVGKLIVDKLDSIENMYDSFYPGNFAFSHDILPIIVDMIDKNQTGIFELCNPTILPIKMALELANEFGIDIQNKDNNYDNVYEYQTEAFEQRYFILPSYQAYQRCLKRIRKTSLLTHCVDLNKECSILVTGGFGFIGSNLIHYLFHHYPNTIITNIDRLDYCSRAEHVERLLKSDRFVNYQIDLDDTFVVEQILTARKIDYVFHLAAQSHVDNSFNNSLQFSKDNVFATHSLLEACKNYGKIKRFIHISTDEIYGETLQMDPFIESELPNPTNPYAATKVGAEYIAKSYYHCFELPVIIIRGNNVYGPHQYPEKMIPRFISLLLNNEPCTIAGNGLMKRNFIHVKDVCAGLCQVLLKGKIDEIYNIGDDDEKSVLDVALLLIDLIQSNPKNPNEYYQFVKDRYYNDFRYSIDTSKIKSLGWKPQIDFLSGLKQTIKYYQDPSTKRIFENSVCNNK